MDCVKATQFWPTLLFLVGVALLTYLIKKDTKLDGKDLLRALIGLQQFQRTTLIYLVQIASLAIPLASWVLLIQSCETLAAM
jgi:hypothetical protein